MVAEYCIILVSKSSNSWWKKNKGCDTDSKETCCKVGDPLRAAQTRNLFSPTTNTFGRLFFKDLFLLMIKFTGKIRVRSSNTFRLFKNQSVGLRTRFDVQTRDPLRAFSRKDRFWSAIFPGLWKNHRIFQLLKDCFINLLADRLYVSNLLVSDVVWGVSGRSGPQLAFVSLWEF